MNESSALSTLGIVDGADTSTNGLTLRQVAARGCKRYDIGSAVLPRPLFHPDIQDYNDNNANNNGGGEQEEGEEDGLLVDTTIRATNKTTTTASSSSSSATTHYARVLESEFNAVVVEHHLKWAPLLLPEPPLAGKTPTMPENADSAAISPSIAVSPAETTTSTKNSKIPRPPMHVRAPSSSQPPPDSERGALCLGRYDFKPADSIVDWALERQMKVKGHVLVWHVTSPKCLHEMEPDQVREALKRHIYTVVGHYRGRIHVWDVVNEALAPDGTLADNVFLQKLGPSYIEDSFQWAHEADPTAILLYNDNKVESFDSKKGQGFYELLADLKAKSVPVHGCGMQAHFNAAGIGVNTCPTPRMVKQQIHRLGNLGLTVNISEMDVRVSQLPAELRNMAQKQIYHDIIAAALSEPAFDGIWLWGFTDLHSWVHHFYYDDEPCVFDEDYERKDAYYGLRDALQSLTPAGRVGGEGVLIDSDIDINGNRWGHLWNRGGVDADSGVGGVIDEAEVSGGGGGDARPDWEQEDDDLPATDDERGVSGTDDDEVSDDQSVPLELTKRTGLPEIS